MKLRAGETIECTLHGVPVLVSSTDVMVTIDRELAQRVTALSEEEGWADVIVIDTDGHVVIMGDGPVIERKTGRVELWVPVRTVDLQTKLDLPG